MSGVGEAPACIECKYVELRSARGASESVRNFNGEARLVVCQRARDPLTGVGPELASVERQVGLCGARGLFWEEGEAEPEDMLLTDVDDLPEPAIREEEMSPDETESIVEEFEDAE